METGGSQSMKDESRSAWTHMLKAQRGLTGAVETEDLHRPVVSAHQDVVHAVSHDVEGVDAQNSWWETGRCK